MAIAHREKVRDIEKRERTLINSFFNQLTMDSTGHDTENMLNELQNLNREKIMVTYNHFEELKEMCTEEQLSKFDEVINQIIPILTNSSERLMNPGKHPF